MIGESLKKLADHFFRTRAHGHTTLALTALRNSPVGKLVVHNQDFAAALMKENPDLKDRIISVNNLHRLTGQDEPILADNFIITQMIEDFLKKEQEMITRRKDLERAILVTESALDLMKTIARK